MSSGRPLNMIAVLGSINMDLVTEVAHLPRPGETVLGREFARYPGGKGANQAVAAARMGVKVAFFGKVGDDLFGEELLQSLRGDGVDVQAVQRETRTPSGSASILVADNGENMIACTPGANGLVDADYIDRILPEIATAKVLLLQFETPIETLAYLLERLPKDSPLVILDPAPAQDLSTLPLDRIDIITPNRGELAAVTDGAKGIEAAAHRLLQRGIGKVICKAGEEGAYLITPDGSSHFPSHKVAVVDTTAAGDAFNGALAAASANGRSIEEAIRTANAAGALAVTKRGAQPSLPTLAKIEQLLKTSEGKR